MGGDHGPAPLIEGARRAVSRHHGGLHVTVVGRGPDLAEHGVAPGTPPLPAVVLADEVIGMDEEPALAVRAKPGSSIRTAIGLAVAGEVDAVVSAGSTGATIAAALLGMGRVAGVRRPAIAGVVPVAGASGDAVVLVDAGATVDVQPRALVDWARLGVAYARARGTADPVVGLLNVGVEAGKGNALTREAHDLLVAWSHDHAVRFVGNVEPVHLLSSQVDVLVSDGFTGNVLVKTLEAAVGASQVPPGALVLGVDGVVVVAHGAAGAEELAAALGTAVTVVQGGRVAA